MKREIPPDSQIVATKLAPQTRWQLDRIVTELRISREETHSIRRDGEARRAPSRDALENILNSLTEALFPRHMGNSTLMARTSIILSATRSAPRLIPYVNKSNAARCSWAMSCCRVSGAKRQSS